MNNITNKILNMNRCALQIIGHKLNMSLAVLQIQNRFYSRPTSFPDYFQNPIFRKGDQAKLIENDELSKIATVPVKPPAAYETSSVYHDPLVKMNTINDKENVDRTFKKCCPFKTEDPIFFSMGITARDLSILHFCSKVINHVMEMGKKQLARSLVEKAFENIKRIQIERYHLASTSEEKGKIELNPKEVLHRAVENCKPLLQLLPIKRGGITYQVPSPITEKRSLFLAIKWLLEATNDKERTVHFPDQFAWELLDAANNTGKVVKRKQDLHRQCEANRAYAHYRWQS